MLGSDRTASVVRLAPELFRWFVYRDPIAFMYHTVSDERLSHFRHVYFHKNAQKFEDDLIHIKRHYHLGDWELLHDSTRRRRPLRKPLAFITFDDGMSECFNVVRPLLLKHSIPCCFFIRTAFVDNLRMFYRHKASLCIERVHTATQARQRELLRTVSRDSWPGLNSLESFTQWVKGLTFRDEDQIDQLCELLAVDVNRYLSEHRPLYDTRADPPAGCRWICHRRTWSETRAPG